MEKIKGAYILWHKVHVILPQSKRYTIGNKIDKLFIDMIESAATAYFLPKEEKIPYVRLTIRKLDTLKVLLMVLWDIKTLENKKYIQLSIPLDEIGRMLGGWHNQLIKQFSTNSNQKTLPPE